MPLFKENTKSRQELIKWWQGLEEERGARATLRRAASLVEIVPVRYAHYLLYRLWQCQEDNINQDKQDKIMMLCGILSHVRENEAKDSFAKQLARKKGNNQPVFSELRFQRLLQYEDIVHEPLFYQEIVRAIHQLGFKANIADLAHSLYYWNDITIKNWAYDYFRVAEEPAGKSD
ncbi:MAG: type I-E CRISPR-associated protein Cse2/CasB [Leptospiraceae bacterium]|nr:type I-E CRISPR-associated protein Cse2/CasB [Leptospiraceae bacterium]